MIIKNRAALEVSFFAAPPPATAGRKEFKAECGKINFKTRGEGERGGSGCGSRVQLVVGALECRQLS